MGDASDAEKLQRRNRELSILNRIAAALNAETDLSRALHAVLAQVAELLGLQTGWVWLLREETGGFYLAAAQNLPPGLALHPQRMEGGCYCLDTFQEGDMEGAANINVVRCSRLKWIEGKADAAGLRFHASIPLYAHAKQLGVLNVASPGWRQLSANELRLLHTIGDLLSIAIERTRLFERSTQVGALEERNRLAREMHDTIAQGLAAIVLQLEMADALLDEAEGPARAQQSVQRGLALARQNMEEVRRSVLDLRAAPLEGRTLAEALLALLDEHAGRQSGQPLFEAVGENRPLPARVEVGLFRIAQEALTNIAAHAQAATVRVRLLLTPAEVRLAIEDDGRGFAPDTLVAGRFGLVGMNERARLMGGTLQLSSSPGEGTRLEVVVPLEQ